MIGRMGTASLVIGLCVTSTALAAQPTAATPATQSTTAPDTTAISPMIADAIASTSRTATNRARDQYRHPAETLSFFRLAPGETVVELFPGGGWYTEILSAYARANGNTLYVAAPWPGMQRMQQTRIDLASGLSFAEFPAVATGTNPRIADNSVDLVLTFRNLHNWRMNSADATAQSFQQIFAMLKPGGRLGVVEHRLPETMDSTLEETSGYMKVSSVIAFAEAAGFQLAGQSEINANPRDTHDYPGGVWTLPPTLRGADTDAERVRRGAIGESDRMTLLFIKPAR